MNPDKKKKRAYSPNIFPVDPGSLPRSSFLPIRPSPGNAEANVNDIVVQKQINYVG